MRTSIPIGQVVDRVSQVHPAVTPSSLRFLEREGLLVPTRTPGGHRLYAESDVERILQIKAWQEQRLSLDEIRERLRQRDDLPDLDIVTQTFLRQVLAGALAAASRTILTTDDLGIPLQRLFGEVIEPALVEIGRGWQQGTVLVAQEKVVSELVRDLVAELSLRHAAPDPQGPTIVAACVRDEHHELGLRMIAGLLSANGCRVHYLGADVGIEFLLDAVRLTDPAAILLSAGSGTTERAVADTITALHNAFPPSGETPAIVVGGRITASCGHAIASHGVIPVQESSAAAVMQQLNAIIPWSSSTSGKEGAG